jgi:toxin-antitoxin system PIN domain toxin
MKSLVDVNVVFALLVQNHAHHAAAWHWWESREDETVVLTLPVRLGILRLLTNKSAMEGSPVSPEEALAAWDLFAADPRSIWLSEPPAHDLYFRRNVIGRKPSPNLWTDAWLAAQAEASAIALTSFDADFLSFGLSSFELLKS